MNTARSRIRLQAFRSVLDRPDGSARRKRRHLGTSVNAKRRCHGRSTGWHPILVESGYPQHGQFMRSSTRGQRGSGSPLPGTAPRPRPIRSEGTVYRRAWRHDNVVLGSSGRERPLCGSCPQLPDTFRAEGTISSWSRRRHHESFLGTRPRMTRLPAGVAALAFALTAPAPLRARRPDSAMVGAWAGVRTQ